MSMFWRGFIEEGDESFNYMINNFEAMFIDNSKIDDFNLHYGLYELNNLTEEIKEKYYN